jgi:flagellar hook-associated protein 1
MASTLQHILNTGSESLQNSRVGVDVTGHNIANAHTPGFSRQNVNLEAKHPVQYGTNVLGQGARIRSVDRAHDQFVEAQWRKELQTQGGFHGEADGLKRLEELFSPEMTDTMRDRMTGFFNSMREFSNYPEEPAVRINLVESANAFAQSINTTHKGVLQVQQDIGVEIKAELSNINQRISEVASLNQSILEMEADSTSRANDLQDRRDLAIRDLAGLVDIQYYRDPSNNVTVRGPGGALLVEGNRASKFSIEIDKDKGDLERLYVEDSFGQTKRDVTNEMEQGRVSGLLKVRDTHAAKLRENVNLMAEALGNNVNAIHQEGYGQKAFSESKGRNFFDGLHEGAEAAAAIHVSELIKSDPDAISGGLTPNAPGDNVIANKLVKLFYSPMLPGKGVTLAQHYDDIVAKVGIDSKHLQEAAKGADIIVTQIVAQREAASGVSLDEEAANLLKYQHLFTASSRVITTADEMFKTVLDLKR